MQLKPTNDTTRIQIHTGDPYIGPLRLWVPEAIASNSGVSAVYPVGIWVGSDCELEQRVSGTGIVGPGNFSRVDEKTFESCGTLIPADNPVEWTTRVSANESTVDFTITLRNLGDCPIHKAGAAVCLRFLDAGWWSAETTFVSSHGKLVSLAELDEDAERPKQSQAYLLDGESYDNVLYTELWGFSRRRLDKPFMVSQNTDRRVCVGIHSEKAYFLHSNRKGPCTDIMLAFGDVAPRAASQAHGTVWMRSGLARNAVQETG